MIYIAEGEKDVDRLWSLKLVATTNPMGAGKWRENYAEALRGADVVIIPDNDGPGHEHANRVGKSLHGVCARVRLMDLPGEFGDISNWLDSGGDIEQLERLVASCPDYEPPPDSNLPEVLVGDRQLRDISAEALGALYGANKPERIFRRSGALSRISLDEKARPFTEMLGESALRGCLARCCNFIRNSTNGNKMAVSPPLDMVRDIASLGEWQLPPLLGITEAPVMRPDGTVLDRPGYDEQTNLYYSPSPKLSVPPIPDKPTEDDIKAAAELVLEPLCDFPFDSEASRANAVATMFTPILRPMIEGPVPLAIIDKPQAGTGASLLAEAISLISTGRAAAMMSAQKNDEEWRKAITSLLIKGQMVVTIDNIKATLWTPSLAAILTAITFQDRILGRSEMVILPNRTTWIGTGNNIKLGGDLPRRCIWVRMDAKMARPWLRDPSCFKHPRLIEWVMEKRGAVLAAILTIARAWATGGRPEAQGLPNLGGYEDYCHVVGGVLAFMGVGDFLGNLGAMYDEADIDTPEWEVFLETWYELIGDEPVTASQLVGLLNENDELHTVLPSVIADTDKRNYSVRLGQKLAKRNNVRYSDGLVLVKAGAKKRAVTWQVKKGEVASTPELASKGEVGEVQTTPAYTGARAHACAHGKGVDTTSPTSPIASKSGEVLQDMVAKYPLSSCPKCGEDRWAMAADGHFYCDNCRYLLPNPGEEFQACLCGSREHWITDDGRCLCLECHPHPQGEVTP